MLEGECNNVLDAFDGHGQRVSREAFADDDLDAAEIIRRAPVALLKELGTEARELEALEITVLGKV